MTDVVTPVMALATGASLGAIFTMGTLADDASDVRVAVADRRGCTFGMFKRGVVETNGELVDDGDLAELRGMMCL